MNEGANMRVFNTLEMTEKLIENPELRAESYTNISGMMVANIGGTISCICPYSGKFLGPLTLGKWSLQAKWRITEENLNLGFWNPWSSVGCINRNGITCNREGNRWMGG